MLTCMRKQLTDCRRGTNKNLWFRTLLCTLFFEIFPRISLRKTVRGHIISFTTFCRWEALFPREGAGRVQEAFDNKFINSWAHQIPLIQDYPYVGISFLRDPDMSMPLGEERRDIGKHTFKFI
jgi:hypothetical protein